MGDADQQSQTGVGSWGSAARDRNGGEVWRRHSGNEVDEEAETGPLDILLAMGFSEEDGREAISKTASVEAAVEFIMMKSPGSGAERGGGWYGVIDRIAEIRGPSDVYNQLP